MENPEYETNQKIEEQKIKEFKDREQNTQIENFQFAEEIGRGRFGQKVFKVINKVTKNMFALKTIELANEQSYNEIESQIKKTQDQFYNFLVPILNYESNHVRKKIQKEKKLWIYILEELCQQFLQDETMQRLSGEIDLNNRKKCSDYDEEELLNILCPIVLMLSEFQKKGIAHRNIKLSNILRCYNNDIKLCDIELSSLQNSIHQYQEGQGVYIRENDLSINNNRFGHQNISILDGSHLSRSRSQNRSQDYTHKEICCFFSPEKVTAYKNQTWIPEDSYSKSDVFSLGMCILIMGNLIENPQGLNQNKEMLQKEIRTFKIKYIVNKDLGKVVEMMLT